jgi:hypothetical protein
MVCNTCKKECGEFYRCYKCNQSFKLQNTSTTINKCITCKKQCGGYKYCFQCNAKKEPIVTDKNNVIEEDNSELNVSFIEETD